MPIQPGYKRISAEDITFDIPADYEFKAYLGNGTYGNVIHVADSYSDGSETLAIKKMYYPFSSKVQARRLYRELRLLQLINHDNVIRFLDIYTPDESLAKFNNVYIVTRYAGKTLQAVLEAQKKKNVIMLRSEHLQCIFYQILRALKYLHSANVIHRDLKPSNIAITESNCDVTILDFGLARTVTEPEERLTGYVVSRYYRSPEIIYWNNENYNAKADVWSVGCIFGECLKGDVLFKGSAASEQYRLIVDLCGGPDELLLHKIETQNSKVIRHLVEHKFGKGERKNFKEFFQSPVATPDAIDFLDKLLVLDPDRRISVTEALEHPYLAAYHNPDEEPVTEEPFLIDDKNDERSLMDWKTIIWNDIQDCNSTSHNNDEPMDVD
uniref:Protein kinase domain-containing protein n=1 Tax=Panagrellus redivivus TaxID=6233 RepID=A0A7E4V1E8_PANRE